MRRPKNRFLGHCHVCHKEIHAFGTPFIVEPENVIYKRYICHTANPKTDCLSVHWNIDQKTENVTQK